MVPHPYLGHVREQETRVTSRDNLVSKKGAPLTSKKLQCFAKYTRKLFPLKVETANVFHHWRQKHTFEHNLTMK